MADRISVVIPTFNMGADVARLVSTFERAGLSGVVHEIVIVDDGSTDGTAETLAALARGPDPGNAPLRPLLLPKNVGRFRARVEGARAATGDRLLFLDSRVTLPPGFGPALARAAAAYPAVMGVVDIDVSRNVFCLYWDRSHRRLFARHYRDTERPVTLTPANYHAYLKGTGVLLCDRGLFLETCARFSELLSDDTFLLEEMVKHTPITIEPTVRIGWVPRENARDFLLRLWERGPSFVEYHVFERRDAFFWAVVAGGVVAASLGVVTAVSPAAGAAAAGLALAATACSTALFARSLPEAVKMAPLHVAVVATFGAGIVRGLAVNLRRRLGGRGPRAAVTT